MRRLLWAMGGLVGLIIVVLGGVAIAIAGYAHEADSGPADAVVVLGAAVFTSQPSPVFVERLRHAAALYTAGSVRKIVVSGGLARGDKLSEGVSGAGWLVEHGVPAGDILIEDQSHNTFQNIANVKPILAANGLKTVLIDSDPLHMLRAMTMALDAGLAARPSPTPTTRFVGLGKELPMLMSETWQLIGYKLAGAG